MTVKQCQAGEVIYQTGDAPRAAYVIQSGEVEVETPRGVQTLQTGALFGDLALVKSRPYDETARARSEAMLKVLTEEELEALVAQTPQELQQIFMHMATGLSAPQQAPVSNAATNNAQNDNTLADSMERFARLLDERCSAMEQRMASGATSDTNAAPVRPVTAPGEGEMSRRQKEELTEDLKRELSNLGPIMPLLEDDTINDVLINGHGQIYVERQGKLELTDITYPHDSDVMEVAEKIVRTIGRQIDPFRPLVDARLLDGSRVNIIAPPLAVDGTTISIRKFAKKGITLQKMCEQHNLSPQLAEFLRICGHIRLNVMISGGTGAGKTTLLNAVSQSISHSERVVTIEDAAELQLQQPHVVRLETKPITSGISQREEVTMRDLVKNSLRMRPDRILVGEVRGSEAFDMMQAMNTGHEGSLTTIHANHPRDALSRLENMVAMANLNITHNSIRRQIASAINLIIQISRMRDGHRRITHVCEIVGMEGDVITMQDLFTFNVTGEKDGKLSGQFNWTGIMPRFLRRVAYYGEAENLSRSLGVKLPSF